MTDEAQAPAAAPAAPEAAPPPDPLYIMNQLVQYYDTMKGHKDRMVPVDFYEVATKMRDACIETMVAHQQAQQAQQQAQQKLAMDALAKKIGGDMAKKKSRRTGKQKPETPPAE